MTHGSLFSGIGGFDLAAQWMGWENVFQVEIDPFCQKVLEKNFPGVKKYGDIKEFDGTKYRGAVDVISGGFPCQKFSLSGKGEADLSLWFEMLRACAEIQPSTIVVENVYGLFVRKKGMVFERVCTDLEGAGYEVQPFIIPACSVGAPHQRIRIWIVAYRNGKHVHVSIQQRRQGETNNINVSRNGQRRTSTDPHSQLHGHRHNAARQVFQNTIKGNEGFREPVPNTEFRLTQSPVCGRNDGIPNRVDRIKSLGNAIVPQVAYEIFKAIQQVI